MNKDSSVTETYALRHTRMNLLELNVRLIHPSSRVIQFKKYLYLLPKATPTLLRLN